MTFAWAIKSFGYILTSCEVISKNVNVSHNLFLTFLFPVFLLSVISFENLKLTTSSIISH